MISMVESRTMAQICFMLRVCSVHYSEPDFRSFIQPLKQEMRLHKRCDSKDSQPSKEIRSTMLILNREVIDIDIENIYPVGTE